MQIQPVKFGIAFGIVYAVMFFLWGILGALFGWGAAMAEVVGGFYVGFGPSLAGAVIGAVGASGDTSDNDEAAVVAGVESVGLTPKTD